MYDDRSYGRILLFTTAGYPINLAKTLVQLGYEPISPDKNGALPNIFTYTRLIRQYKGYLGLFTGFHYTLSATLIKKYAYRTIKDSFTPYRKSIETATFSDLFNIFLRESCSRVGSTFFIYPITTVGIGYISSVFFDTQRPLDYTIAELYNGFMPRAICDLLMIWVEILSTRFLTNLFEDHTAGMILSKLAPFLAYAFLYPLAVVSVVMADDGRSGLNPRFDSWIECWSYLSDINQLKRGSSFFWRRLRRPGLTNERQPLESIYKTYI